MKTLIRFVCMLICLISAPVLAVYDYLSINIVPTKNDVQFCFNPNYSIKSHTYLAVQSGNEFFFLSPVKDSLSLTPFISGIEPPIFFEWQSKPACLGPYSKESLQGISVYAGVGTTLSELLETGNYSKIFGDSPQLPRPTKEWTIMIYVVGSNLESSPNHWASHDILEMLRGTQTSNSDIINIVVTTGGSQRYGWNTVKRSFIHDGQKDTLEDLGKQSMSSPQALSEFVQYAKTNFPAQHYALILWNHGGGTGGFGQDFSDASKGHVMNLTELHQAYQSIRQGGLLDIVVYDACLMSSIEVAEVTSQVANVMAGSTELEPGHGLNYEYLLKTISADPPKNGIEFGKIVKTGYLQQAHTEKTVDTSQITYSVLDLNQLSSFSNTLKEFSKELYKQLDEESFLTYEALSQGIIRAPGYPFKQEGKLLRSLNEDNIRIDLYNVLQTVSPRFTQLRSYADQLQTQLNQLVVDYEVNDRVKVINPEAGRISLDIGSEKSYLSILPTAYTELNQALKYYNQKRKNDTSSLTGSFVCPGGFICADAKWLELSGDEVISIDGYYGQQSEQGVDVFLIKPLYRYQSLSDSAEIGVNGQEACQLQLCVSDTECGNITVTEKNGLWLADILHNDFPAILTLCTVNQSWQACSVVSQQEGVWGRDEPLSMGDRLSLSQLGLQNQKVVSQSTTTLTVGETVPIVKSTCNAQTAVIVASYFGNNNKSQFERLCDKGDCVCKENDKDESCRLTNFKFKAGIRIEK